MDIEERLDLVLTGRVRRFYVRAFALHPSVARAQFSVGAISREHSESPEKGPRPVNVISNLASIRARCNEPRPLPEPLHSADK